MRRVYILSGLLASLSFVGMADKPALNPLFSDHMVVAEGQSLRVFGTGDGLVDITFRGARARTVATDGAWCLEVPSGVAGGPFTLKVDLAGTMREITDVYVGEVLVMAGQSNLQFTLAGTGDPPESWVENSLIRNFSLPRPEAGAPFSPANGWVPLSKRNAGAWSAIGYYVAVQRAARRPGVAIGIVSCFQGASAIQGWMPASMATDPKFKLPEGGRYHGDLTYKRYAAWNKPGALYEKTFLKLAPYAVSHVTWYQGESNTGHLESEVYPQMFAAMATQWRKDLRKADLPFTVVQIADFDRRQDSDWKALQEAQLKIPQICKYVTVVKSADVCESNDIHPKTKSRLSERIAATIEK
ncbi:MAG: hypothetical protein IKR48_06765 [Kiritimatiellae bacterium]|nr:hypothetical protein [Kiritimatiellia bacterium]